jgi:glycosyltransferase involved in cell wall biosynthesis
MKVAAYVHWKRTTGEVTGVGRHIRGMVMALSRAPGVDLTVMAPREELPPAGETAGPKADTPLNSLPRVPLPLSRYMMERVWWLTNYPKAERYVPNADWIYSPADAYVPARRAQLATTIHDIEVFEDDLPWAGRPGWDKLRRNWRLRLAPMFKHARRILTVSEFSKQRMVELLGADPKQIAVVGNGVDPRFFAAADDPATHERARRWQQRLGRYIVTVGGLTLRKGADYLIPLAEALRKAGSDVKLAVSGQSDRVYVERARPHANIAQLEFVADDELPALLRGAVALVFLSRYEGFGMPIVEAMAAGTPAIVSRFASLPEVAGDAGIVVDVNQPDEIARLVMSLAEDASARDDYVRRGLVRARQFTWEACAGKLLEAMREA